MTSKDKGMVTALVLLALKAAAFNTVECRSSTSFALTPVLVWAFKSFPQLVCHISPLAQGVSIFRKHLFMVC